EMVSGVAEAVEPSGVACGSDFAVTLPGTRVNVPGPPLVAALAAVAAIGTAAITAPAASPALRRRRMDRTMSVVVPSSWKAGEKTGKGDGRQERETGKEGAGNGTGRARERGPSVGGQGPRRAG